MFPFILIFASFIFPLPLRPDKLKPGQRDVNTVGNARLVHLSPKPTKIRKKKQIQSFATPFTRPGICCDVRRFSIRSSRRLLRAHDACIMIVMHKRDARAVNETSRPNIKNKNRTLKTAASNHGSLALMSQRDAVPISRPRAVGFIGSLTNHCLFPPLFSLQVSVSALAPRAAPSVLSPSRGVPCRVSH